MIKQIQIWCLVFVTFGYGCKSIKPNTATTLSYSKQKKFATVYFEASKYKVLGDHEKSLNAFIRAYEINPKSHEVMFQLAKQYYALSKFDDALFWAEKAVGVNPEYNHWYYGQLGQFYNKFGKYEQSAGVFAKMTEFEPDNRDNYTEAANQFYNAKKPQSAIAILKKMQSFFGIEPESSTRLEFVYTNIGQTGKAVAEMEKLANEDPLNIQYLGYLSDAYISADKLDEAIKSLNKIIALDPNSGKAHFSLYAIYNQKGKEDVALEHLKKAFAYDDLSLVKKMQSVSGFFLKLRTDKRVENSLLELSDILLEVYPQAPEPYILRSDIYGTLRQFEDARLYTLKALEIDPSDFKLWSKLMAVNAQMERPDRQIEDATKALENFPNQVGLYVAKAYALYEVEAYEKAISITENGMDVAIDKTAKVELLSCKASSFEKLNETKKAESVFEAILAISPYNATVLNNYAYSLSKRMERLDKADSMIDLALKLEPSNPYFMDTKAWILYGKKEYADGIVLLEKAMKIDPKNSEYYVHARTIYQALGNTTMANEMSLKIKELTSDEK